MTIDKDTPLEEILDSNEVSDIVTNAQTTLSNKLSAKSSALSSVMSGGLGESVLIDGEAVFFNDASTLKGIIDSINEEIISAFGSAISLSEEKETEELTTLKTCVEKEITNLTSELNRANGEYARAQNNYSLYSEEKVAQIEASFTGENGCITVITANKKRYEEKLEEIIKRLGKVEASSSSEDPTATNTSPTEETTTPTTKTEPVVTTVCDKVNVDGREMYYVGTTKDGINLYAEPIEGEGNNGNIPEHAYIWYNRKDGSWIKSNATYGFFSGGNGANVNGEVIYYSDVSRSVSYDDPKDAPFTVVEKGIVGEDYTSVYYHTAKGNDFTESAVNITYDTSTMNTTDVQNQFKEAIENHQNIVLSPNVKVQVDPWGWWNTTTLSNGQDYTYLVYDEHTDNYYVTDSSGTYNTIDINTGYAPEDFLKDDGGVYFS